MIMDLRPEGGKRARRVGNPPLEPWDFSAIRDEDWPGIIDDFHKEYREADRTPENESRLNRIGKLIEANALSDEWKRLAVDLDAEFVESENAKRAAVEAEARAKAVVSLSERDETLRRLQEQNAAEMKTELSIAAKAEAKATEEAEAEAAAAIAEAKAERVIEDCAIPLGGWSAPVSVRLQYPFTIGEQKIRGVEIAPPTYGTVERLARGEIDQMTAFAAMTGLSAPMLRALRMPDADRVFGAALDMLPDWSRRA